MMGKDMYRLSSEAQKAVLGIAGNAFGAPGAGRHIPRSILGTAPAPEQPPKPGK